jgi:hypothetical protein
MALAQVCPAAGDTAEKIAHALDGVHFRLGVEIFSKASRTTSERLRFSRLADRSNLMARSAGNRMVSWRSKSTSPLYCSVVQ